MRILVELGLKIAELGQDPIVLVSGGTNMRTLHTQQPQVRIFIQTFRLTCTRNTESDCLPHTPWRESTSYWIPQRLLGNLTRVVGTGSFWRSKPDTRQSPCCNRGQRWKIRWQKQYLSRNIGVANKGKYKNEIKTFEDMSSPIPPKYGETLFHAPSDPFLNLWPTTISRRKRGRPSAKSMIQ